MKKVLSKVAQLAMFCLGVVLFAASLWLLVRFFAFGDNHPINIALGFFGLAPVLPNVADMDWFSSLLKIFISCASAVAIYLFLASLAVAVTQEASAVIAAGGLKNYRALKVEREKPGSTTLD